MFSENIFLSPQADNYLLQPKQKEFQVSDLVLVPVNVV
jgi:hypothetical protein